MSKRRAPLFILALLLAAGWLGVRIALAPRCLGAAQNPPAQAPATAPGVIKAEANLVLVDVIAMDKKGSYVDDLEAKDFHVFEDDKEQPITSFSRSSEAGPSGPGQRRYLVLFFDNSTMATSDQARARQAAAQFVEKNTSPDRLMAVVDFGGTVNVAQNFTSDSTLLKRAVSGVKFSAIQPGEADLAVQAAQVAGLGTAGLNLPARYEFGARSMLLAVREVARMLRGVPGRKTLILFSGGFVMTPERQSELLATIDALNKANVAVYPVDVRGLTGIGPGEGIQQMGPTPGLPPGPGALLLESPFPHLPGLWADLWPVTEFALQRPGGGGGGGGGGAGGGGAGGGGGGGGQPGGGTGGGGGTSGGGGRGGTGTTGGTGSTGTTGTTGGGKGGTGTGTGTGAGGARGGGGPAGNQPSGTRMGMYGNNPADPYGCTLPDAYMNPNCVNRQIIPPILETASANQQVLYALAKGTGGFPIFNTNDFLAGLEKVYKDLSEYYILGYVPPNAIHEGTFHSIRVKVDRKGVEIRARNGYYDVKSPDILAGKPEGKALEERAESPQPGDIPVSAQAPCFYTSPGVARVNLALEVPASSLDFEKLKGKYHSEVNVLGIAYRADGSVAARFSDTKKLDLEKKEMKEFSKGSFPYQNTFDIAPGKYTLKVVLGAGGEKFGKYELPLEIAPFDGKKLELSGPALSNEIVPASQLTAQLGTELLEERTPLLFQGNQFLPSPDNRFHHGEQVGIYVEVYDPFLLDSMPPHVGVLFNIFDRKTNKEVFSSPTNLVNPFAQEGSPLVPVALRLPTQDLQAGEYRLEVVARDAFGNVSTIKKENFVVE